MKVFTNIWKSVLLLILAGTTAMVVGCSSDDDENLPVDPTISLPSPEIQVDLLQGYWLSDVYNEKDMLHQGGLCFRADGSIIEWYVTPEKWEENEIGKWILEKSFVFLDFNITDNSFRIKSLTANQLVIDHLNDWTGKHTDYKYNKMMYGPLYVN